jgi:hypothetical protein
VEISTPNLGLLLYVIFKEPLKENNRPMNENFPNLVTLIAGHQFFCVVEGVSVEI